MFKNYKNFFSELPVPCYLQGRKSLKTLAKKYWDLNAVPRPRFFELLSLNCPNELETEKLTEFTKPENADDLYSYANRPKRTVLETLLDFPHATSKLTLEVIFEMFQPIKPRSFSIASACESNRLSLLVAVVEYKTILQKKRKGFCSNWLKTLEVGMNVAIWLKKGSFKLPPRVEIPMVMVGPGTGLAPFLSFIESREERAQESSLTLFFGSRNKEGDFHCREQLEKWNEKGLIHLITAFSRDQEEKM